MCGGGGGEAREDITHTHLDSARADLKLMEDMQLKVTGKHGAEWTRSK